jgi:chromosome segregation ATPase
MPPGDPGHLRNLADQLHFAADAAESAQRYEGELEDDIHSLNHRIYELEERARRDEEDRRNHGRSRVRRLEREVRQLKDERDTANERCEEYLQKLVMEELRRSELENEITNLRLQALDAEDREGAQQSRAKDLAADNEKLHRDLDQITEERDNFREQHQRA